MNIEWRNIVTNEKYRRTLSHCYVNGTVLCKSKIKRETIPERNEHSRCNQCKIELLRVRRGERKV